MQDLRLPRHIRPRRYELRLEPHLDAASFDGAVEIDIDVDRSSDAIVLHAAELDIVAVRVDGEEVGELHIDDEAETITIAPASALDVGAHRVRIDFVGALNDKLRGFYRSTYRDDDGTLHTIATTQFQSTDARRAMPCWDEPDFKAVFSVTLVVEDAHLAVSNGAEISSTILGDGRREVRFADTIPMSTYLVAFVVGPLEATEPVDVDGTALRIVHRPGQASLTSFGLDVATAGLRYFREYYDLAVPGGKVDLIAVPDFAFGAMENLGCIIFRDVLLLIDTTAATQREQQNVAAVVNHELAHLWFGDLVTMSWWNGIWLNEAFATFMETLATDRFRPEWDVWTTFSIDRSAAFEVDSLATTRPIEFPVHSPAEAEDMFDVLTYEKGAAVLRMLEQFIGENAFRDGVRATYEITRFANTETHDLWEALESATDVGVRELMETWIFQGGFPLVELAEAEDGIVVTQRPFTLDPSSADDRRWIVPLALRRGDGSVEQALLRDSDLLVAGPLPDTANADAAGFYRVGWNGARSRPMAPAAERYALLDDAWAMARIATIDADAYLDLVTDCATEREPAVWNRILASVATLAWFFDEPPRSLRSYARDLTDEAYHELCGRLDELDDRHVDLHASMYEFRGTVGADPDIVADAATGEHASAALRGAAARVRAHRGDETDFDRLLAAFRDASSPQDEQRYLFSLAELDEPALITRLCELALTDTIRTQNAPYLLGRLLRHRSRNAQVWDFVADSWERLVDRFPSNSIPRMIEGVRGIRDREVAERVDDFLTNRGVLADSLLMRQSVELMHANTAFAERSLPELRARFA